MEFTCIYCGVTIREDQVENPTVTEQAFTMKCPGCGMPTMVPFPIAVKMGGKIPGEE